MPPVDAPPQPGQTTWVPVAPVTYSGFGYTFGELTKFGTRHRGLDLDAAEGDPVWSPVPGRVLLVGRGDAIFGNYVVIRGDDRRDYTLAHLLADVRVAPGQRVAQRQALARVGCTGRCFGAHVHYEVKENGRLLNPANFLGKSPGPVIVPPPPDGGAPPPGPGGVPGDGTGVTPVAFWGVGTLERIAMQIVFLAAALLLVLLGLGMAFRPAIRRAAPRSSLKNPAEFAAAATTAAEAIGGVAT